MPTSLASAQIALSVQALLASALDIGSASYPLSFSSTNNFADGVGADQAKEVFADTRTLTASSNEDLDLSGVLLDAFGVAIVLTKIKALIVKADPTNVNDVVVGAAASNAISTIFGATTHTVKVKPGGLLVLVAPDVNGYGVTAATADLLRVTNGGAGTSVNYTIIVIGTV